jgi:carbon-monoxide dehydrogenase large subunit
MAKFGFGQSIRRKEDNRFLTGNGRYTDDIDLPGETHGHVVRSPHAHARFAIKNLDQVAKRPGVIGILTGADAVKDKLGDIPCETPITNRDGSKSYMAPYPVLCPDEVRHVGDAVAFVVAESPIVARDAAEALEIDWEELPAVVDTAGALDPGAAEVWPEAKNNLAFDWELGNRAAVDAAFKTAHRVARVALVNNRVVVHSMETRGAIAAFERQTGEYTLYTCTQGSHGIQAMLANAVLKVEPKIIRVVTPDVGGGFGMKGFLYREHALVCWAAKRFGRPVKWACERADAFLSDTQGRDHVSEAELALDKDGRFLALKVSTIANLGAYLSNYAPFIPTLAGTGMLAGLYATPAIYAHVRGVFTHTIPVDAYRGAGRPEAAFLVERLVDLAARAVGLTPAEIRRRNFIAPAAMPFKTALGETYDSGEFAAAMEKCLKLADWEGAARRKAESERRGRLRGIGMATYVEACGGGGPESAWIEIDPAGAATVKIGTQSGGQGHETAYAQLAADGLGIDVDQVRVLQGDTAIVKSGGGTGGSRSLPVGGAALSGAVAKVIEKGKKIAAHVLEAAESDIEFQDGRFVISGTDRSLGLFEAASAAKDPKQRPAGADASLDSEDSFKPPASTYPNGCHIAEVEVDPATGAVDVVGYTIVDDFGTVLNPMLLEGQVHGGVVQGLGQALLESCRYDPESGQLLTGSLMDYCLPRAFNVPPIVFAMHPVKCRTNPLGIKGCGEAGAIGAPPTVINALVDALAGHGVVHIDMPATPERVWAAIHGAGAKKAAE